MNTQLLIGRLAGFAETLPSAVAVIPDADARWRPEQGGWSILEIVAHLADEEIDDFRMRTELTLRDPELPWPPIDPEGPNRAAPIYAAYYEKADEVRKTYGD